jgi:hypothetical protein
MINPTKVIPFRGYDLAETYREGKLRHCDVWQGDKLAASFHGVEARDRAKRWVLAEEARQKYPRISMRRVSKGR